MGRREGTCDVVLGSVYIAAADANSARQNVHRRTRQAERERTSVVLTIRSPPTPSVQDRIIIPHTRPKEMRHFRVNGIRAGNDGFARVRAVCTIRANQPLRRIRSRPVSVRDFSAVYSRCSLATALAPTDGRTGAVDRTGKPPCRRPFGRWA